MIHGPYNIKYIITLIPLSSDFHEKCFSSKSFSTAEFCTKQY
jgi:hypothetical protein